MSASCRAKVCNGATELLLEDFLIADARKSLRRLSRRPPRGAQPPDVLGSDPRQLNMARKVNQHPARPYLFAQLIEHYS